MVTSMLNDFKEVCSLFYLLGRRPNLIQSDREAGFPNGRIS